MISSTGALTTFYKFAPGIAATQCSGFKQAIGRGGAAAAAGHNGIQAIHSSRRSHVERKLRVLTTYKVLLGIIIIMDI